MDKAFIENAEHNVDDQNGRQQQPTLSSQRLLEYLPGMVLPRAQKCAKPVRGGTLILTAKEIDEPKQATFTYRIKYKTKEGDRQRSGVYNVSLFP